jgi:hypothetical protein
VRQRKFPVGDGAERHRQPEERQERIGLDAQGRAVERGRGNGRQLAVGALQRVELVGHDEVDLAGPDQRLELGLALGGGAELVAAMDHRDALGDLGQGQRPVDGGVAAAGNHHALAAETFAMRDVIKDALAFVGLDAGERWPVGTEGADAGGDNHCLGLHNRALGGGDLPEAAAQRLQRLDLLAQVIDRTKGRGLRLQADHQLGRLDAGKARHVIDRLLGIERRALAAGMVEHVDHMAMQPHHAAFEHGEQADGARAYDDDVGLVRVSVGHGLKVAERNHKIKPPVARDRGPNLVAGGGLEPPTPAL